MVHHAWRDGRHAWNRLEEWAARLRTSGTSGNGDAELDALDDIGRVRHLLDQAELTAVRMARVNHRSWTEIATRLGVTRQSAWERWRDVDADDASAPSVPVPASFPELDASVAAKMRRRVKVPSVVGLPFADAVRVLNRALLSVDARDIDGAQVLVGEKPSAVVSDQIPEAGAKVRIGTPVRLWLGRGRGGGAGVREPRRPKPSPSHLVEMRDEPRDESVSEAG